MSLGRLKSNCEQCNATEEEEDSLVVIINLKVNAISQYATLTWISILLQISATSFGYTTVALMRLHNRSINRTLFTQNQWKNSRPYTMVRVKLSHYMNGQAVKVPIG
jgi:hypothetical protein